MVRAFVCINVDIGTDIEVLKELKQIKGIKEAYTLYGVYDLIAMIEADVMTDLKDLVHQQIRKIDKVRSTLTMIVQDEN